jgi:CheY-like chemotaxis protein
LSTKPKPKILVVDDQPINIKLLQRKLERQGMEVFVAYNGRECLNIVGEAKPDLILLDIMMPEMDGIETCQHLKANPETETIPIIFITAKASKEGKLEGLDAGAVDYITKPIDLDETIARVRTQLRLQEMFREKGPSVLEVKVVDQGTGIDPEVTDTLFEPFITTKTSVGRGMGLTIARHTMRNLEGEIRLIENPDGGCTATMTHPL